MNRLHDVVIVLGAAAMIALLTWFFIVIFPNTKSNRELRKDYMKECLQYEKQYKCDFYWRSR